jgi:hypothetical protein
MVLQQQAKARNAQYSDLFDVWIKVGDVLVRQQKYEEARDACRSAVAAAEQAAPTQRIVDWQIALSVPLEQAGDFLAHKIGKQTSALHLASAEETVTYLHRRFQEQICNSIQRSFGVQGARQCLSRPQSALGFRNYCYLS